MKNMRLVTSKESRTIELVPDYDFHGDVNFLVLPKNDFIPDSLTDEINFYMIDGCEKSGIVGNLSFFVKWEVL